MPMKIHPYADIYPRPSKADFMGLVVSIREHGLRHPIVLDRKGRLIDGRSRAAACTNAGVDPRFKIFEGSDKDIFDYIKDCNYHRRHLTHPQRSRIAAAEANLPANRPKKSTPHGGLTQEKAAAAHDVSPREVQRAAKVEKDGTDALKNAAFNDETIGLEAAAKLADEDPEVQNRVALSKNPKQEVKKVAREKKEQELGEKTTALPEAVFNVILADPAWKFETWSEDGKDRAADNHYPTQELNGIMGLVPPAAEDSVLFLWATAPMNLQALDVMKAWGFTYKTQMVWVKDKSGTGYWARNKHELLLIGTRGKIPAPAQGEQPESAIEAPRGKHSRKPDIFYEIIEGLFPNLPKLELYAREERPGWTAWGNEIE